MSYTIEIQRTSDPCSIKFFPGRILSPGGVVTFANEEEARVSPLALALINLEEVLHISFCDDFVLVTKSEKARWEFLQPDVLLVLAEFVDEPVFKEKVAGLVLDDEVGARVDQIIADCIRPVVRDDGGEIEFLGWKEGRVYVRVDKACAGCPSAGAELKERIERLLQFHLSEIEGVVII